MPSMQDAIERRMIAFRVDIFPQSPADALREGQ